MVANNIIRVLRNHAFSNSQGQWRNKQINWISNYVVQIQKRTFLNTIKEPDSKYFCNKELIGYSKEQMFDVISDVENYPKFLPWCKDSVILVHNHEYIKAKLKVGATTINDSYISYIVLEKPHVIKIDCIEGKLVQHLASVWRLSPGLTSVDQSCVIDFQMCMKFYPALRSHLIHFFFNQLASKVEWAFMDELDRRFGPPAIKPKRLLRSSYIEDE